MTEKFVRILGVKLAPQIQNSSYAPVYSLKQINYTSRLYSEAKHHNKNTWSLWFAHYLY